jgi:hypothetical protein
MLKTPETYRDLQIVTTQLGFANGNNVPQRITRVQSRVQGRLLQAHSWGALKFQIDEQLDRST